MSALYKIRSEDGLFSRGGYSPRFDKKGKMWSRIGDITTHLRCSEPARNIYAQNGAKIVEYTLYPVVEHAIATWINDADHRRAKRELPKLRRRQEAIRQMKESHIKALQDQIDRIMIMGEPA